MGFAKCSRCSRGNLNEISEMCSDLCKNTLGGWRQCGWLFHNESTRCFRPIGRHARSTVSRNPCKAVVWSATRLAPRLNDAKANKEQKRIAVTSIESIAHIILHQLIIESVVIVSQSPKLCNQVVLLLRLAISQRLWGTTNCCWPHRCLSSLRTHQLKIAHRWPLTVSICRLTRLVALPLVPFPFSL